jgi:glycosyltransferase involved in cell wall biosynthesis
MKIAVITCYHDPDYVRARSLRAGLKLVPGMKTSIIKNSHKGVLRYPEVLWKIWRVKKTQKPDAYLLTFRGQEILPFVLLLAGKKPVIFDELVIPIAYATNEKHARSMQKTLFYSLARMSEPLYRRWLRRCVAVLADTTAHAELSARTSNMNLSKYTVIPVGTDEKIFKPMPNPPESGVFRVFYYSSGMQPLHGIPVVLEAAVLLKDNAQIEFLVVGGKKPLRQAVKAAASQGANITYQPWIAFRDLPATMQSSGLCLGGPFGDTVQAQHVITTKTYQMLAAGVPVVVGASPVSSEYFIDKENALVVPQGNAGALAKTISWAQKNSDVLPDIAVNGRKLYDKQFSIAVIGRILQSLVSDL